MSDGFLPILNWAFLEGACSQPVALDQVGHPRLLLLLRSKAGMCSLAVSWRRRRNEAVSLEDRRTEAAPGRDPEAEGAAPAAAGGREEEGAAREAGPAAAAAPAPRRGRAGAAGGLAVAHQWKPTVTLPRCPGQTKCEKQTSREKPRCHCFKCSTQNIKFCAIWC